MAVGCVHWYNLQTALFDKYIFFNLMKYINITKRQVNKHKKEWAIGRS